MLFKMTYYHSCSYVVDTRWFPYYLPVLIQVWDPPTHTNTVNKGWFSSEARASPAEPVSLCPRVVSFFTKLNLFQVFGANPLPWDVNNEIMSFFIKTAFSIRAQEIKFWKYYGKSKNKFLIPLSYWGSKRFASMRRLQIWSQNWAWIIVDPYFGRKKTSK